MWCLLHILPNSFLCLSVMWVKPFIRIAIKVFLTSLKKREKYVGPTCFLSVQKDKAEGLLSLCLSPTWVVFLECKPFTSTGLRKTQTQERNTNRTILATSQWWSGRYCSSHMLVIMVSPWSIWALKLKELTAVSWKLVTHLYRRVTLKSLENSTQSY